MSTSSIVFVILIIVQTSYVLTLSPLINCTDCDILGVSTNKSRMNALFIQEDIVSVLNHSSASIHDFKQRIVRNNIADLTAKNEQAAEGSKLKSAIIGFALPRQANFDLAVAAAAAALPETDLEEQTTGFSDSTESVTTAFTKMTSNDEVTGSFSEITEATISFDWTTMNAHTTSDNNDTATALNEAGKNLPLILGLTLGLGIPASLATIGGLVYYLKIYRPGQTQVTMRNN